MIRDRVKRSLLRLGRTGAGKHAIHAATAAERGSGRFTDASWPEKAESFEDLDFLLTSSQLNHGIASLRLDEAALLFRLVRSLGKATIAELGRFKGGSTFLMAVGMAPGSTLWSYDLHLEVPTGTTGAELDRELRAALDRYGLDGVNLVVGDTRTIDTPDAPLDLVFIDADHRYEGARADFERWSALIRPHGHLLFHDAVDDGWWGNAYPGIQMLAAEIDAANGPFRRARGAGSIAHYVRADLT